MAKTTTVNFTNARVADFKPRAGKIQDFQWDTTAPGLGQCASKTSSAYVFQFRLNGKPLRLTIGKTAAWRLSDVREEARRLQVMVDRGLDPRLVKAANIAAELATAAEVARKTITFGEVWAAYLAERKPRWGDRHYNDHVAKAAPGGIPSMRGTRGRGVTIAGPLNYFMPIAMNAIDNKLVEKWAEREAKERATSARLAWRMLKVFFQWCYESDAYADLLPHLNPGKTKKSGEFLGKVKTKSDNLKRAQLSSWFAAMKEIKNPTISAYLQVVLLTGARPGEVRAMKWEDIDWQWKSIVIRDKVDGTRSIPLTPFVEGLLTALPHRNEFIFTSEKEGVAIISEPNQPHTKACTAVGLQGLTLHGLRRSFASLAEQVDIPPGVAAQIQGHKPQSAREKSYIIRPFDVLQKSHAKIEAWILEQSKANETTLP